MNKEMENKLVPKLRFPEFENDTEWKLETLSELLDYERPDAYIVTDTNYKRDGTPVLTANKSFILGYTNETKGIYENLPVIIFDDFTIDRKYVDFPFKIKSSAIKILKAKNGHNLKFIYELISLIKFEAKEHKRYYISAYQILQILIPGSEEQQKIANCLSSLDDFITAENEKLNALKNHKKGLMQQLFPAEGEKVPKLRFPEFRDISSWEEIELGNIALNISSGKDKVNTEGGYNLYGSTGIIGRTNEFSYDGDFILVARVGANAGLLTRTKDKFGVTDNTLVISLNKSENIDFIHYNLDRFGLNKLVFGSGQPLITGGQLKALKIYSPKLIEQQKIADCLSSLDNQISLQTQKIETLKFHKKGLMQQLFPNTN